MQQRSENIKVIGVSFRSGANREGTHHAPQWLMRHLFLPDEECCMLGFQTEDAPLTDQKTKGVKNFDAVLRMINAVRGEVISAITDHKKVIVLGGDHSIAMGSIAGMLEKYPNIGVIWFDAHTDINTEASSPSGHAHGMPLAALMGLCESEINNIGTKLNPTNVFWVCARDIDEGEWEIIKRIGIEDHVYTCEMVRHIGMKSVMNKIRIKMKMNGVKQMHLSFDIDGMDPLIVPATGTPVERGGDELDCDAFVDQLSIDMPQIVSLDFVEYNPMLDDNNYTTGKWCLKTLNKLISIIGEQ